MPGRTAGGGDWWNGRGDWWLGYPELEGAGMLELATALITRGREIDLRPMWFSTVPFLSVNLTQSAATFALPSPAFGCNRSLHANALYLTTRNCWGERMRKVYTASALVLCLYQASVQAQPATPSPARNQVIGQATSVDTASRRITLRDDRGGTVAVSSAENTSVLRIPPGETDIKKAAKIEFTEIGSGDRILAVGGLSQDGKELQARTLVVMSKSDIAQKQQRELRDWQTRGIAGTVSSVDTAAKSFTVKAGLKMIAVDAATATEFRRYAPDSVKFSDSVASSFGDVKPGDQIRAMGDKSADGLSVKAERVVSGSFRQLAGTISAVRADANEIRINDLASKKPVTISANSASVMKKLSPVVAATLARRFRPAEGGTSGAGAAPAGRGPGGSGDIGQLLDRLPAVSLADLKPGDAIMVSGSAGNDAGHLTAITLLAGVEPLLTASPDAARDIMAGWNFGEGNAPE